MSVLSFKEYKEKTFPLVDFYKKSRKLITVNAEDGKDDVLGQVVKKFDLKKKSK